MRHFDLPKWAQVTYNLRHQEHPRGLWEKDEDTTQERYSQVIGITYPAPGGVYYVVDALRDDGWAELQGTHYIPETAFSSAQKRTYMDRIPHRVREVIWNG